MYREINSRLVIEPHGIALLGHVTVFMCACIADIQAPNDLLNRRAKAMMDGLDANHHDYILRRNRFDYPAVHCLPYPGLLIFCPGLKSTEAGRQTVW